MNIKIKTYIKKIDGEEIKIQKKEISVVNSFKVIDEEKGIFEAYVSIFGNVDSYGEVVDKGAFTEFLSQFAGRYPKGVWAHDWSEPIIKTLECKEDDKGLYVKGQFVLEVQRAKEIYALMKAGVITDFSFGFRVMEDSWDEVNKVRHLKKIAIYEYSPVLVGANSEATLIGVKADGENVEEEVEETISSDNEPAVDAPAPESVPDETDPTAADVVVGDDEKETPGGSSDPAPEENKPDEKPADEGKSGVATTKKALANAINALKSATDALEALNQATEDEGAETPSDTSKVEKQVGKDSNTVRVVKAILRDARKADKMNESIILRAKEIIK